eukprot:1917966-Pleurochrysis_carterae.AAC.3
MSLRRARTCQCVCTCLRVLACMLACVRMRRPLYRRKRVRGSASVRACFRERILRAVVICACAFARCRYYGFGAGEGCALVGAHGCAHVHICVLAFVCKSALKHARDGVLVRMRVCV